MTDSEEEDDDSEDGTVRPWLGVESVTLILDTMTTNSVGKKV